MATTAVLSELWREGLIKRGHGETLVEGNSMAPTINPGDTVVFKTIAPPTTLAAGDIAVVDQEGETVVHRIISATKREGLVSYRHKGDNSLISDLVKQDQIVGRVISIKPRDGRPIEPNSRWLWLVNRFVDAGYRATVKVLRGVQRRAATGASRRYGRA
jgi:signal peptidase I